MQNNFEKNVQQKMDGLKLTPSAAVWERVEVEIGPEKRKRRGILWLLFAGLLLLGGGWWLHQTSESNKEEAIERKSAQPHRETTVEMRMNTARDKVENTETAETGKSLSRVNTSAIKSAASLDLKTRPVKNSPFIAKRKTAFATPPISVLIKAAPNKKTGTSTGVTVNKMQATPIANKSTKAVLTVDSTSSQSIVTQTPVKNMDSAATKEERKDVLSPVIDSTAKRSDSALKKKVASASKWRKRLNVGAGISGYAEGPFFRGFNSNRDALYLSALSSPGAPVAVAAPPSPTKSGFAFSFGFSMAKSFSKRWELSIGLQYAYASTHQKVGDKKTADTTVQFAADKSTASGFYTNAGTSDYTNGFHFVEVPVSVSFKPSLRVPLYISLGAAYGRLLSTNALTFSSASNLYYQNKENYLRNAFNISSSLQIDVWSKKKRSLRTGPFVHYNAVKLRKETGNGTPHLLTAGIKTAIIF